MREEGGGEEREGEEEEGMSDGESSLVPRPPVFVLRFIILHRSGRAAKNRVTASMYYNGCKLKNKNG